MDTIVAEAPPPRQGQAGAGPPDIERQLTILVENYRRVLAEATKLPMFSIWPALIFFWHYLLAFFGLFVDLILAPYNLAAFVARRFFGAKWRYIAPAAKRIKYALLYFWRGEVTLGAVIMRPAVRWLVRGHVANRLPKLAELVYLSPDLDDAARFRLIEWLEREQKIWAVQDITQVSLKGTAPTLAIAAATFLWNQFESGSAKDLMQLYAVILGAAAAYFGATLFLGSFPTKRGLFLGRSAKRAWAPGGVPDKGLYPLERDVFAALGGKAREVPVDGLATISLSLASLALLALSYAPEIGRFAGEQVQQVASLYRASLTYGQEQSPELVFTSQITSAITTVVIFAVALVRRSLLQRN